MTNEKCGRCKYYVADPFNGELCEHCAERLDTLSGDLEYLQQLDNLKEK